jgi:predicted transglutaminase-like cysteine proteinase
VILPTTGQAFTLPPVENDTAAPCPDVPPPPVRPSPPNIFGTVALPVKPTSMSVRWDVARQVDPETMPATLQEIAAQAGAMPGRQKLTFVNSWVNNHIAFTEDGDRDHWASVAETFRAGRGDCEDFAIAKLALLLAAGAASDDLFLVIVRDTVRGRDHAVLAARLDGEMLVLDSRTDLILPSGAITDYRPMFSFAGPFTWMHGYKAGLVPIVGN